MKQRQFNSIWTNLFQETTRWSLCCWQFWWSHQLVDIDATCWQSWQVVCHWRQLCL